MRRKTDYLVFIIEDSEIYSMMLTFMLRKNKKIKTMAFVSAESCLEYVGPIPDLIILDHELQGITGLEAIKDLKVKYLNKPIIVMSSQDNVGIIYDYMNNGATDYIIKTDHGLDLLVRTVDEIKKK
jgi:FixJ family two-component response regulator